MRTEILGKIAKIFAQKSAEERAHIIVKQYFLMAGEMSNRGEIIPDHLKEWFIQWLLDPRQREAKDDAMQQVMMEMLG